MTETLDKKVLMKCLGCGYTEEVEESKTTEKSSEEVTEEKEPERVEAEVVEEPGKNAEDWL